MMIETKLPDELFSGLFEMDAAIAAAAKRSRCASCGGPLHTGDYERKPRGGILASAGETATRRFSLCCGSRGCRARATPPSVRFLGRKVYVEVAILMAGLIAIERSALGASRVTGIPKRTVTRWQWWWRSAFVASALWVEARARAIGLAAERLPVCLVEMFGDGDPRAVLTSTARFLAPLSTTSVWDGARFLRDA